MNYIERLEHRPSESIAVVLTGEVEPVDLLVIPPLVKRHRGLIVLESLENRTVDDNLVVLQLPADHAERIVHLMMIELDLGQAGRTATRYPFLVHVVVHHHRRAGGWYAHFAVNDKILVCTFFSQLISLVNRDCPLLCFFFWVFRVVILVILSSRERRDEKRSIHVEK